MAPFAHAMGFVNGNATNLVQHGVAQAFHKIGGSNVFRGHKDNAVMALKHVIGHIGIFLCRTQKCCNIMCWSHGVVECLNLILHQGNQRRHDNGCFASRECRHLIDQWFAMPRWPEHAHVLTIEYFLNGIQLGITKGVVPIVLSKGGVE